MCRPVVQIAVDPSDAGRLDHARVLVDSFERLVGVALESHQDGSVRRALDRRQARAGIPGRGDPHDLADVREDLVRPEASGGPSRSGSRRSPPKTAVASSSVRGLPNGSSEGDVGSGPRRRGDLHDHRAEIDHELRGEGDTRRAAARSPRRSAGSAWSGRGGDGPLEAVAPTRVAAITAGARSGVGGQSSSRRGQGVAEVGVAHRTQPLAHPASSTTARKRAIARERRDLTVPGRTPSTSAVSFSDRPRRNRYPITSRSGGGRTLSAATSVSRSAPPSAAASGDGAASPSETAAARRARPWRRRVDRARFRASLATIFSSHGRKGESGPEPGERVIGLHERLLGRVLRLTAIARDQPGDTEGDLPVPLHQLLVRIVVALAGSPCELGVLQWSALHGSLSLHGCLHRRRPSTGSRAPTRPTASRCPSPRRRPRRSRRRGRRAPSARRSSTTGEPPICLSASRYCRLIVF